MADARHRITVERIAQATGVIDPVFLNSPQYLNGAIGSKLGCRAVVKLETLNPIRSFKGRGAGAYLAQLPKGVSVVCASAGNFGQGIAYCAFKFGIPTIVYAPENANPVKVHRMREFGAEVRLEGLDFDTAKAAARIFAQSIGAMFAEDGKEPSIAEGAGTIALELTRWPEPFDAVVIPVGNGSLIAGMGAWFKHHSPHTRVIGVCARGAPAMEQSWRSKSLVTTEHVRTVADGIAVRVPVPEALRDMEYTVDEMLLVEDDSLREAMRLVHAELGVIGEPAGVAAFAAVLEHPSLFRRQLVALPLCGSNTTAEQLKPILSRCC